MRYHNGYTLIEVLVVLLLILVLTGLLLPVAQTSMEKMRISKAMADIAKIEAAAEAYQSQYGVYPAEVSSDKVPVSKLEEFMVFPS
ncbi:MAG: prepilin-type N-terminal cleavage/methylation domain-containing protein, partial [Chlamydiota bacterium]|nr:prepilin-type N-terminal cleavage/methylation domain-containing protein [Chlamydiota bacterium]